MGSVGRPCLGQPCPRGPAGLMNPLVRCRQMAGVGAGVGDDVGADVGAGVGAGVVGPGADAGEGAGVGAGECAGVGLGPASASCVSETRMPPHSEPIHVHIFHTA